jgi:gliding motility-associated-like protein
MKKTYSVFKSIFFLAVLTLGSFKESRAQSGTDFWFAPPFVTHLHNSPGGVPIYLLLSSMGSAATVTVSIPANGGFVPIVVTIPASKSKRINLSAFQAQLETYPTNSILNTGLHITSTAAITANYEEDNTNNPEDFALKGANALGTEFYIPLTNYAGYPNNVFAASSPAFASFDIVASQNGTVVTIYSPLQVDGHAALTQFSITLNAGQTYSCGWTGANYQLPSTHPAGAAVHSNRPIAITVKDDSDHNPSGGCYDLIGDQIIPTNILGTDYVAVKGFLNNGGAESMFITATQNNTNIYIDGNPVAIRNMFAGETFQIIIDSLPTTNNSIYVRASNPVYATHVTGFGCEMGSAILPPLNCAGSHQVNFMRSTNEAFYLTLLVHASATGGFTITGPGTATINPASFVTVPGTGGLWKAARIQYTLADVPVDSAFSVVNNLDVFALGIINGGGATGCRYGYFSEFVAPIVVNAGIDQTICANDTAQLAASITGGSTTGIWTTSGTGAFLPSSTTINAMYVPSPSDIAATQVTLTLTSTSICFPQADQMLLKFTPAPKVNAGSAQSICRNNPAVTLAGSVTVATGGIWSGGAGTFTPSNTTLNAVYTPTAAEIAGATLVLTLTSTGNGSCHAVSNSMVITFTPAPTANAGPDVTVCSNNANVTMNGTVSGATGGIWSGGTGSFSPSATALNAVYSPSATEISAGSVTLTLTTTGFGNCQAVSDQMIIKFTLPPTVNAGVDQNICKNNASTPLSGVVTIASGGSWTGGLGTFSPNNTTLNATYTPTATELASGSMTLTLTSTGNGTCTAVSDQMIITFTSAPTVNAGASQTVCKNNANATLNGTETLATGGLWSGGTGTFNPNSTTLNAVYTPGAAELTAGTVTLTLTTSGNGNCSAVSSNTTITISPAPVVNAGPAQTLCVNNPNATLAGSVTIAGGGVWSGGAGGFSPNNTTMNAVYTPTAAEISSGSVTLTLTSTTNGSCNPVSSSVKLSFTPAPTVNAGPDQTVCANNATVSLNGAVTVATGGAWSGGLGTFTPNNNTLNATYAPTAAEIGAGSLTLTLTTTGNNKCTAVTDQMIITFTTAPTVNAGIDQTVCKNNPAVVLNGSETIATGGTWSGGTGTYSPNANTLNATYTPGATEVTAGAATLTLTTTGNGKCSAVSKTMNITLTPSPVVSAGPNQVLCSNNPNASLSGSVSIASGGIWSGGTGTFGPSTTALNAIYTPTAAEITSGSVTLTLTSTGNGQCNPVTSTVKLSFTPAPTVNAGIDQTVCANNASTALSGAVTVSTGGQWSGGLGTFSPNNSTLNATYTATAGEIASGSVTLALTTTGNNKCNAVSDQMLIRFSTAPTVNAGTDQTVCKNNPAVLLNGSVTIATGGTWSGGSGTFNPNASTLNSTYTPGASEITAGTATLTLTSTGNGTCSAVSNTMNITLSPSPLVSAGPNQILCANNPTANLNGSVSIASGGIWSNGAGVFAPSTTALNATYTPTVAEIASGSVTLTLTSTGNGQCNPVTGTVKLSFTPAPTVNAGTDQTVCANNAVVSLNGIVTVATGGQWSGGLGTFTPNNTTLNATYTPTAPEIASGSVSLTLTSAGNNKCTAVSDQIIITFTPAPTVNAGSDQTVCKNNPAVLLNGSVTVASGGSWSGGAGSFAPNANTLNATYTPSAAEITAGTVTLTLTSTGNGSCTAVTNTMNITLTPIPVVNAGPNQILCGNNPNATLSGSVTIASGGIWSGGAGSFSPSNTALNAIYTPAAAEISSGSVTLTLTSSGNGQCNPVSSAVKLSFTLPPTANAGVDQVVCANNSATVLNGAITIASGGQWSGGLGTFSPNSSTLNATYSPTAGEVASGALLLTLTSTGNGNCNPAADQMKITFTPAPTINAGANQSVCANNAATTLNATYTGAGGILWSGGAGSYVPNNTTANAVYTPSASEKTTGTVTLTVTTTGNGNCLPVSDNMTITITPAPQVNAGTTISACANKSLISLSGTVLNAGGAIWSGGAGTFLPAATALNASYTPTATEISSGSVTLTLTSTGNGSCNPVSSNVLINFAPAPVVNAGADQTVCANNSVITLNGFVNHAAGGVWSGGLGAFSPAANALNASYTPTQTEINSGTLRLILSSTGNASCNAVSDTMVISFSPAPTVNAGSNLTTCGNNPVAALHGAHTISAGAIWSGGAGTYAPSNTAMNTNYTPTAAEIASGTVVLKLTTTGNGTCLSVYDSIILTITPKPVVNAGSDQTVCVTNLNVTLSGSISGSTNTGAWTTLGTGVFTPSNTSLNASYHCSKQDSANGFVNLVLTSTNNGTCLAARDTVKINILPAGNANAGSNATVCGNNATVILNGSVSGGATSGTWSTAGTGAFTPNRNILNAHYVPSAGDIASGSVVLTLTANSCNPASSTMTITITPAPSVNAGTDQTVCSSNRNILLNGSVAGGTTTGLWTSTGTGSFVPNNTTLNATYQATSADSAAQVIYLVLHSTNNGSCVVVTDTMRLNIYPASTVNAGPDQTVCANNAGLTLNGSVSGGGPGTWSTSGSGVFNPNANTLNASYSPSAGDITAGSVNLVLNATSSCNAASDFMVVHINPAPTVNAGPDQSLCGSNPAVSLSGSIASASGGIWSGGNGTFNPSSTTLNASYTPTSAEIASGSLILTLTSTGNGICNAVTDQVIITFTSSIVANAGVDQQVCKSGGNAQLQGIVSNGSSSGIWSTLGSGTFSPADSALNALYVFSAADTSAGKVTLILTSTHNGMCAAAHDTVKIAFGPSAFASAGPDQNICNTNSLINLNGLISGGTTSGQWSTLGSGAFNPNAQALNASYTLSAGDLNSASVKLILSTTNNGGCKAGHDTMVIAVNRPAVVSAGASQTVCSNAVLVNLNGSVSAGSSTGQWVTKGAGSFAPNAQALNAAYNFGAADYAAGKVKLVLTSTNNAACPAMHDTVVISLQQFTVVNAGSDKTVCSAAPATILNGSLSGATNTSVWTSSGTGSFTPNAQSQNATYNPGSADLALGSVYLILSSTSTGVCPVTADTMKLSFLRAPVANAGPDQALCNGATTAQLNGSIGGGTSTGIWSTLGSGTFNPNAQTLNATYTPGAIDVANGKVSLVLESTNNGVCSQSTDTVILLLLPVTKVNAGVDQSVCSSTPAAQLNGNVQGGSSTGIWSTLGSGSFSPNTTTLNANYTPSVSDISNGKVKLVLSSSNNGNCNMVTDTVLLSITPAATANAGMDQASCSGSPVQLNGLMSGGSGTWITPGTGSFVPNANAMNAMYVPSQADRSAGSVKLILESTNSGLCPVSTDTMKITFGSKPLAAFTSTLSGMTATFSDQSAGATTWIWNFGNGGGLSTQQNPSYTYAADGTYTVSLIITNASGCSDTANAKVIIEPVIITVNPVAVPSGFTPNGDHVNDGVQILGGPFEYVDLKIYNQWGNIVYNSNDPKESWDGTYKGTPQPAGVYIYTAHGKTIDGKEFNFSGDITLIR